jgi:hypothetical protein
VNHEVEEYLRQIPKLEEYNKNGYMYAQKKSVYVGSNNGLLYGYWYPSTITACNTNNTHLSALVLSSVDGVTDFPCQNGVTLTRAHVQ